MPKMQQRAQCGVPWRLCFPATTSRTDTRLACIHGAETPNNNNNQKKKTVCVCVFVCVRHALDDHDKWDPQPA